jgi:dihydroxyacetone kinase-like protein
MKKLINGLDTILHEQLTGLALAHPQLLAVHFDPTYITRAGAPPAGKVAVVSGGGSGHEPLHGGFVGPGMLDGACPGAIFTSPTPDQIAPCAQAVDGGAGVLLVVKNYTGDVLSFETAAELLHMEGVCVRTVLVDDDVAVKDSLFTAGRRGVAGALVVEKIAGAAAAAGWPLEAVAAAARRANAASRSLGMALTSCTVPAVGRPTFSLGDDEIEIGVGIHGEPGRRRMNMARLDEIVAILLEEIMGDGLYERVERTWDPEAGEWREQTVASPPLAAGDRVLLLVNGMGGTPLAELYAVYGAAARLCAGYGLAVARSLVGAYVTSLEMAGCSITLTRMDDELLRLWDAPVHTAALRWGR